MKIDIFKDGKKLSFKEAASLFKKLNGPEAGIYDPLGKYNEESDWFILEILHLLNNEPGGIDRYEIIEPPQEESFDEEVLY